MKPSWEFLINESSLAAVLPDEYAHFARPVCDGLKIFLSGLCAADQAAIVRVQAALPSTADFSQRLGALAQCSPVLHKLGQVLARDQRLPWILRKHLQKLESLPPKVPLETIQKTLARELGPLDRRGVRLAPPAIAEASVAVVIPFEQDAHCNTKDTLASSPDDRRRGVLKILKTGIEQRMAQELGLLNRVGEHLDQRCRELNFPHLDYQESFQQVGEKLSDEVQLANEQRHLAQAREFFADERRVQIPRLFDHCTSRVTSMERLYGVKITDHQLPSRWQRKQLARTIAHTFIARPMFSRATSAMFHGDPHAGNLMLTDEGRLGVLDWSLVGRLGEQERAVIVQIMLGAITLDAKRIARLLLQLAERQPADTGKLTSLVHKWVARIRRGQMPGLTWLVGMLDDVVQNAQLRVSADMMLFRKTLHTLEGVLVEVGASGQLHDGCFCEAEDGCFCEAEVALLFEFLCNFAAEWPQRWLRWPHSRDSATRLSTLDLTRTLISYPAAVGRFWAGHACDLLQGDLRTSTARPCFEEPNDEKVPQSRRTQSRQATREVSCPSNV